MPSDQSPPTSLTTPYQMVDLPRGQTGCCVGQAGTGLTHFIASQAAQAVGQGLFCAVAALDVPDRLMADRIAKVELPARQPGGLLHVNHFEFGSTSIGHVSDWIRRLEAEWSRAVDCICIDSVNALTSVRPAGGDGWLAARQFWRDLRGLAADRNARVWTALQVRRGHQLDGTARIHTDVVVQARLGDDGRPCYQIADEGSAT